MKRVLVTGASGFVGRHVCSTLLERGWVIRAAVRNKDSAVHLPQEVERVVVGDIGPGTDWQVPLQGVECVVHAAGLAHVRIGGAETNGAFYRVNTQGTTALARACVRVGVQRIVFISSIAAVGIPPSGNISELDVATPLDSYGKSKLAAEEAVREAAQAGLETVVLRPPLVYGPGVGANFLRIMQAVHSGWPLPLGACTAPRSMLYVCNLADIVYNALVTPGVVGETFHVADEEIISSRDLVIKLSESMGRSPRILSIPVPMLRLAGRILGRSYEIDRLIRSYVVPSHRWRQLTGWRQPYTVDDGVQRTVAWFLQQRYAL